MNLLNQSAFLKALGWSLLDSLWQMGLLWLVYVGLTMNGKKLLSRQRHTIALLSLAGGSLWFLITLVVNFYKAANGPEIVTLYVSGHDLSYTEPVASPMISWLEPALPFLSLAWLLTIAFLFIRFYRQYLHTQRLFTEGLQKAHPEWRAFLQEVAGRMGIKKKVQIWLSSIVDTPVTLGFLKPIILLPVAAVNKLTMQQAEAIILHELNHISRNDYLVNLLIACVDVLFFFNPFSKLLTGIIRREREHCCDDLVLQFRYDAQAYARALLTLEQNRMTTSALVLAATGKDKQLLLNRVKRILGREPVTAPFNQRLIAYLLTSLLIGFIGWYNPGKVIVKKIDVIRGQVASTETPAGFTIPVVEERETKTAFPAAPAPKPAAAAKPDHKKVPDSKDPLEKLEQLIELTTEARLATLEKQLENMPEQIGGFVNVYENIDFSLPQTQNNVMVTLPPAQSIYPYVPGNSFFYQTMEDTTMPKKYIMTVTEAQAKEAMEKAMKALQQVDWKKMESALQANGKKVDVVQLQRELLKAMQEVDWNKVNAEVNHAAERANEIIKAQQQEFVVQLGNYQKDRVIKQERLKQAQQQILLDRMEQHEQLKRLEKIKEEEKKKASCPKVKVKKIVQI
jgi:beta-lactamase regulating signal transducer with metallopeptidase domain